MVVNPLLIGLSDDMEDGSAIYWILLLLRHGSARPVLIAIHRSTSWWSTAGWQAETGGLAAGYKNLGPRLAKVQFIFGFQLDQSDLYWNSFPYVSTLLLDLRNPHPLDCCEVFG